MPTPIEDIRKRLLIFADREAVGVSPLYEHLARQAAADDDVAGLLTGIEPERARATLLFAAAHRLVLGDPISDLANYYPTVGGTYGVDAEVWPMFRSYVLDRAERMRELLATRSTQTNEVRRAALLYPAVALAAKQARGPVGLLEVGTSAGLLLGLDRYGYQYAMAGGEQRTVGPAKAPLVLRTELSCPDGPPTLPKKLSVGAKVGLDRAPVDLGDEESLAWLEACIWADQPDRLRRLGLAAAAQRADRPELVAGDAVDDLAAAAARVPAELPLVVLSSHVLVYLSAERREAFVAALRALAARRDLWWISQEAYAAGLHLLLPDRDDLRERPKPDDGPELFGTLGMVRFTAGKPHATALARTSGHAERLHWLG